MLNENVRGEWLPFGLYGQLESFLIKNGLRWEGAPERCAVVKDEERIYASAAIDANVIKYVAVDAGFRQTGWAAMLVSMLIEDAYMRGRTHLFLFTKSENAASFSGMGFSEISEYMGVSLLECGMGDVKSFARKLEKHAVPGVNGAIVMNANPFTLGHRYLIETAANKVDRLHVFMVREEKSVFPFESRYGILRKSVSDLENVVVHKGGEYILSHVTFPSYFMKASGEHSAWQAGLDVELFRKHIAPSVHAAVRFAGDEPFDPATGAYNEKMLEILPAHGIRVEILPRFEIGGEAVSASRVREYLKKGETEKAYALLPEATKEFLETDEGKKIIGRL